MRVKTSELEGAALDYMTGVADGRKMAYGQLDRPLYFGALMVSEGDLHIWNPSSSWGLCGGLIDTHVGVLVDDCGTWYAEACEGQYGNSIYGFDGFGSTPLVAVCRAIVAAELGDMVDVPDELMGDNQ